MRRARWPLMTRWLLCGSLTSFLGLTGLAAQEVAVPVRGPLIAVPIAFDRPFIRGDANIDMTVNIADATSILTFLFPVITPSPTAPGLPCRDAADANDDEQVNISDPIYLLAYLFSGGLPMPAPFPDCGLDSTAAADITMSLNCRTYPSCVDTQSPDVVAHVLRRAAFGHTPELFASVMQMGADQYVLDQLDGVYDDDEPGNVNQELYDLLNVYDWNATPTVANVQRAISARALLSREQLREQMTDFWENHFNTYIFTIRSHFQGLPEYNATTSLELAVRLEGEENERLRAGALESFHDLLLASATGVPMLIYLDSILNVAANPNENYAREIFELHTLGVDNIYNQNDIEELARCFTGWTICKKDPAIVLDPMATLFDIASAPCLPNNDPTGVWAFHFNTATHDYAQKVIFSGNPIYQLVIPARTPGSVEGLNDGLEVIAQLAGMSPTAEYVSRKLIQKFLRDTTPPAALVAECIGAWGPEGDIAAVLEVILTSDNFLSDTSSDRWNLVKTPYEYALGSARILGLTGMSLGNRQTLINNIRTMLSRTVNLPFQFSTPDGFPSAGPDQLGTSKVLERVLHNGRLFVTLSPGYNIPTFLTNAGVALDDVDAIVDYTLSHFYQSNTNAVDRQLAVDYLSTDVNGVPTPLDPGAGDYTSRLRQFLQFVASFPQSIKQ
ncbi:MAG: DUF1800 family protein [Planctomycetota bacterium]